MSASRGGVCRFRRAADTGEASALPSSDGSVAAMTVSVAILPSHWYDRRLDLDCAHPARELLINPFHLKVA